MNAPNLLATDKRPRLLLVDDDPTNLHVLRQILGEDYRLSFATDGRKALQLAQHQPDLILLDIMMPELDGYAVCRQLKAQADTARIPVIFITAFPERLLTGERPEPTFLVTKPFNPDMVKALISQALFFEEAAQVAA